MPKDAQDVERKELVEHIRYTSPSSVKSVVGLLQKKLAEQGWKTEGSDFNAPASSILRRKRGEASLTIFVKPATPGCTVQIMSEGLNWTNRPRSKGRLAGAVKLMGSPVAARVLRRPE